MEKKSKQNYLSKYCTSWVLEIIRHTELFRVGELRRIKLLFAKKILMYQSCELMQIKNIHFETFMQSEYSFRSKAVSFYFFWTIL